MAKANSFDVLKKMSEDNLDIRLGVDIIGMKMVKAGTQVKMGIAGNIIGQWMSGELNCCLLVFNKKQFDEVKAKLEAE